MRLTVFPDDARLELRFEDRDEAQRFFMEAQEQHGFMLYLEHRLTLFQQISLEVLTPATSFSLEAEVVQLFAGPATVGTAFKLADPQAPLTALTAGRADGGTGAPKHQAANEAEVSPFFRIRALNPSQRFRLAAKATRAERAILLRDTTPQVLLGLLNHPRLEDSELLELVKSNYATAGIMQRVADNRKWMANHDIRSAVIRSPKTPPQVAIKHLDSLPTRELGVLAKSGQAREILRKAALKRYLKRTGQHGV